MVVLYSRDRYEIIGLIKISYSIKQPCSSICLKKSARNASKIFKQCSTFVKQNRKLNILIYPKLLKCHTSPKFCLPNCLPAVRPSSARCKPPNSHCTGEGYFKDKSAENSDVFNCGNAVALLNKKYNTI